MLQHMARSSSGSGRRPLKAEITSSNLVRATIDCSRLLREPFSYRWLWAPGIPIGLFILDSRIFNRQKKFELRLAYQLHLQ